MSPHWKPVLVHQAQLKSLGSFWQGKPFPLRVKALLQTLIEFILDVLLLFIYFVFTPGQPLSDCL